MASSDHKSVDTRYGETHRRAGRHGGAKVSKALRVIRASNFSSSDPEQPKWLIEDLWGAEAVGMIGGPPKSCKSWLALEMAVAVASGNHCLGHYAVPKPGSVLIYPAEDAPAQIRERLDHLARARGTEIRALDVHLILDPEIRLDRPDDLVRLRLYTGDQGTTQPISPMSQSRCTNPEKIP